jgi:hypothetical protein
MNNELRKDNDSKQIGIRKLLSPKDVTEILGIRVKTIHNWVVGGRE